MENRGGGDDYIRKSGETTGLVNPIWKLDTNSSLTISKTFPIVTLSEDSTIFSPTFHFSSSPLYLTVGNNKSPIRINGVANPAADADAANKYYVDSINPINNVASITFHSNADLYTESETKACNSINITNSASVWKRDNYIYIAGSHPFTLFSGQSSQSLILAFYFTLNLSKAINKKLYYSICSEAEIRSSNSSSIKTSRFVYGSLIDEIEFSQGVKSKGKGLYINLGHPESQLYANTTYYLYYRLLIR